MGKVEVNAQYALGEITAHLLSLPKHNRTLVIETLYNLNRLEKFDSLLKEKK